MPAARQINAKDFVHDFRSGMTDRQLAEKYRLSPDKLEKVYNKLLEAKAISAAELAGRCVGRPSSPYPQIKSNFRVAVREKLDFPLAIYEKDAPDSRGFVLDVSVRGVGVTGIEAVEGETKILIIPAHEIFHINSIEMEAICRWATAGSMSQEPRGGFEILNLIQGDMEELQMLIRSLPLEDRVAMRKKLSDR
jgi:hypothetical protein